MNIRQIAILFICVTSLLACSKKQVQPSTADETGNKYFSLKQFAEDQFKSHLGSPFVITKLVDNNGATDSIIMNSYNADWGDILKVFYEADIGKKECNDHYTASDFIDETSYARVLYYETTDPKMFTKTLQIRVDPENNRILSLYIEASKKSFWNEVSEKLYYVPMKEIQIQKFERPLIGANKTQRLDYKFNL